MKKDTIFAGRCSACWERLGAYLFESRTAATSAFSAADESLSERHLCQRHSRKRSAAAAKTSTSIPKFSGTVKQILVAEGQEVKSGQLSLLLIDDSIQRATVEQLQSQAAGSLHAPG